MIQNLVTGGSGFVGSHLVELLLARGEAVTVIDDLSTGSVANLDGVRDHPHFRLQVASILDPSPLAELIDRADRVYHLAAAVGVRLIVERPVHTIETNIRGTEVVLGLAARKSKPVLLASTSEVYGKSAKVPFAEGDDLVLGSTTRPRWAYACSKAIDEFLALAYHAERGLPVVIARLFNTVGERQTGRYGMVIPRFVAQALAGEDITVYGDGTQSRCFGYVGDVVGAFAALMDEPEAVGRVFNVGNDGEITMMELADMVNDACGGRSAIRMVPFAEAYDEHFEDMQRRVPDLSKIKALTGYAPTLDTVAIVRRVVDWTRARG